LFMRDRRFRKTILRAMPPAEREMFLWLFFQAYEAYHRIPPASPRESVNLPLGSSPHRVSVRRDSCNVLTYYDVVVTEQYGKVRVEDVRTIVDCGANVGLASAYLLWKYPEARVIAIEPDPVNHALCVRNLEQFGPRATILRAAVCGYPHAVTLGSPALGTWASTVIPAAPGQESSAIEGIDIPSLMTRFSLPAIELLKIDIEGGEAELFAAGDLVRQR
jgi:FkbM family methyltransferase